MYYLEKEIEISAAHSLSLDYYSKCGNLHGHNWKIKVFCKGTTLNKNGMLIDFAEIKRIVDQLDHTYLNEILPIYNSTAENIARFLCEHIPYCYRIEIKETKNNKAVYEKDKENEVI